MNAIMPYIMRIIMNHCGSRDVTVASARCKKRLASIAIAGLSPPAAQLACGDKFGGHITVRDPYGLWIPYPGTCLGTPRLMPRPYHAMIPLLPT